jgi:hypothetical protein
MNPVELLLSAMFYVSLKFTARFPDKPLLKSCKLAIAYFLIAFAVLSATPVRIFKFSID